MSKLLFKLRHVGADEIQEVRELLDSHDIAYRETGAGLLGFSVAGFWVEKGAVYVRARQLLDVYQQQRQQRVRAEYEQAKLDGTAETFMSQLKAEPLRIVLMLVAMAVAIVFVFLPFFLLRQ